MSEPVRCKRCGGPLPPNGELGGGCPRCMFQLGFESSFGESENSQPEVARELPSVIGRYRVLGLIGEGGMGSVYEAEQEHPRRTVALKIIKLGMASPELLRRFEQESQALGRLQHPGIAQIYEAGTVDTGFGPQPYFAMELIRGRSLLEYSESNHLTISQRLQIMVKVCEAVQHAHQRGLIHRDLKPGNILVDDTGQPKTLDFGVARVTDSDARATVETDLGQLVGTLAYMSPEQALADPLDIDTRSDVYSLGVILYELLAGRLPYDLGRNLQNAIQVVREKDPPRLSASNQSLRGDIEIIVAKALEKDRRRRYASAAEMSADIQRHLNDEPIVARPASARYQLQKFARRNKALVGGIAAVFVVLVAGVTTTAALAVRISRERDRGLQAEKRANEERDRANANEDVATKAERQARRESSIALMEKQRADNEAAISRRDRDRIAWHSLARESVRLSTSRENDELAGLLARQALLIHNRTSDEPRYLVEQALQHASLLNPWGRVISGHEGIVTSVSFSAGGTQLASGSVDRTIRIWDLKNPNELPVILNHSDDVGVVSLSPGGKELAASTETGIVAVWNLREPGAPPIIPSGYPTRSISSLAFSPDGSRLAIGGVSGVWIWTLPNFASPSQAVGDPVTSLAFSPDGSRLATTGAGGVRIWDLSSPRSEPLALLDSDSNFVSVAFSSDDFHLAASHLSGRLRVWDLRAPTAQVWDLAGYSTRRSPSLRREIRCNSVAFSHDGKLLASAGEDGAVRVWEVDQPRGLPLVLPGHSGVARAVAFSDGDRLASAGNDHHIRVWDLLDSSAPLRVIKAHEGNVESLTFSPNNAYIVSGGTDQTGRVWHVQNPTVALASLKHEGTVRSLDFSPDGLRLATATTESVRIWNMRNLALDPLRFDEQDIRSIVFSRESNVLAVFSISRSTGSSISTAALRRWDLMTPARRPFLENTLLGGTVLALSSNWSHLASGQEDGSVLAWDLRPNLQPTPLVGSRGRAGAVAFSLQGSLVAAAGGDRVVRVWNLANPNAPVLKLQGPSFYYLAFSLGDTRLVGAGADRDRVRIWDLREPASPPVEFKGSSADILSVAISRDGTYLAFGDSDGKVWLRPLWAAAADYLCTRVSRNLSLQEWHFYVGKSIPYERTCPALPQPEVQRR